MARGGFVSTTPPLSETFSRARTPEDFLEPLVGPLVVRCPPTPRPLTAHTLPRARVPMPVGLVQGGSSVPPGADANHVNSPGLSYTEGQALFPPGVAVIEDFLAPSEEQRLLSMIDSSIWSHDLGRRTQQNGYKFDYTTETVVPMPPSLDTVPPEIAAVSARMCSLGLPCPGDQCIINEYVPGQGIGAHVDLLPDFGDVVASVRLNGWCTMVLHPLPPRRGRRPVKFFLPPGSLLILEGEARHLWAHSIPKTSYDVDSSGRRWPRRRRVSVTLRSMNKFPNP